MTPRHLFGLVGRRHAPIRDAMATNYFARLPVQANAAFVSAIHDLVTSGKNQGWINNQYPFYLWLICNVSQAAVLLNLTSPSFSSGSVQGPPYFSQYQGATGVPALSSAILPGIKWSDVAGATPSSHFFGCYLYADHNSGDTAFGATGGGSTTGIRPHSGPNLIVNLNSVNADTIKNNWSIGMILCARADPNQAIVRASGNETIVQRTTYTTLTGGKWGILSNGSASYGASSVSAAFLGSDPGMATNRAYRDGFEAALNRCMIAIGAIDPTDLIPQVDSVAAPAAFGPGSMAQATPSGLRIFRNSIAPADTADNTNFTGFPGTDFQSVNTALAIASTSTRYGFTSNIWGCRAITGLPATNAGKQQHPNPAGPPIFRSNGVQVGTECTSYERADACTFSAAMYHLGNADHQADGYGYLDALNAVGIPDTFVNPIDGLTYSSFIPYATAAANADALFTLASSDGSTKWGVLRDVVVGPNARMCDAPSANLRRGLYIDWEVTDARSGAVATAMLIRLGQYLASRGYTLGIGTDALNGSVSGCGLNKSNLYMLLPWMTVEVTVTQDNRERDAAKCITNQLALLTGPNSDQPINYGKIILNVGIGPFNGEMLQSDVLKCRSFVQGALAGVPAGVGGAPAPMGVRFSNGYGAPGGAPTRRYNEIIATMLGLAPDIAYP